MPGRHSAGLTERVPPLHHAVGLKSGAIGLSAVTFQSVANMAPGAAVAFSLLFAAPYAGGATPLAILAGLIACLLVAVTIGQLARQSAGC